MTMVTEKLRQIIFILSAMISLSHGVVNACGGPPPWAKSLTDTISVMPDLAGLSQKKISEVEQPHNSGNEIIETELSSMKLNQKARAISAAISFATKNMVTEIENDLNDKITYKYDRYEQQWLIDQQEIFTYNNAGVLTSGFWEGGYGCGGSGIARIRVEFDINGNILTYNQHAWGKYSDFDQRYKEIYTYNEKGLISSLTTFTRDLDPIPDKRTFWTYTAWDSIESQKTQQWENGGWVNDNLIIYEYNDENSLLKMTEQFWSNNKWNKSWFINNTYNSDGKLKESIDRRWRNGVLQFGRRIINTFSEGNIILSLNQSWSKTDSIWQDNIQTNYSYDQSGRLLTSLSQFIGYTVYLLKDEHVYSYFPDGKIKDHYRKWWSNGIISNQTLTYSYDAFGNVITITKDFPSSYYPGYIRRDHTIYTYDSSGNRLSTTIEWGYKGYQLDVKYQNFVSYNSHGDRTESMTLENNSGADSLLNWDYYSNGNLRSKTIKYNIEDTLSWVFYEKEVYSWRENGTSKIIRDNPIFHSYPNPFNANTSIVYDILHDGRTKVTIMNILGQEIATLVDEEKLSGIYKTFWNGTNDAGVAVSAGMYFCYIQAGKYSGSLKILLLK